MSVKEARILARLIGIQAKLELNVRRELTEKKQRFPFTDAAVKAMARPAMGVVTYYDSETPGLRLEITAAGSKRFVYYKCDWFGGEPVQVSLGKYPQLGLDEAQRVAQCHYRNQYAILEPRQH